MPTFRNTLFHLHRQEDVSTHIYLPMKMEHTECSETSACKLQTSGNYPEESIQHTEHGESLKSRKQKNLTLDRRDIKLSPFYTDQVFIE
jgi:hypothetical protein